MNACERKLDEMRDGGSVIGEIYLSSSTVHI